MGTPPSPVAEGSQLRARKQSEMGKRTAKAKRTHLNALERREESAGNSRPKGSEEAARHGEGTVGEVAPSAPSTRQRKLGSRRDAKKGKAIVRNLYGVSCPAVIPLHCVDPCNITRIP